MSGGGLQPHRRGSLLRTPGMQLDAMLRGADAHGQNPADTQRAGQRTGHNAQAAGPQARKSRPSRASRPSR